MQRKCCGVTFTWILWHQKQATVLLSSDCLSQSLMTFLLLLSSSILSQMTALGISSSVLSQQMMALLLLWASFCLWLQQPQKISFCFATKTAQKLWLPAFCIPPWVRLTMHPQEISCCFLFETTQQLWYQVFWCLAMLNVLQLWLFTSVDCWISKSLALCIKDAKQGRLVTSRLIAMAFIIAFKGLVLQVLWRLTMMASNSSITISDDINRSIAIGDGIVACCPLSWLCLVPILAPSSQL